MKHTIELRRVRDFGQTINDTFTFFKENFKPLFKALVVICGFFILLSIIASVFTYMNMSSMFTVNINSYEDRSKPIAFFVGMFIFVFIALITQACIHLVTLCYMSLYLQKEKTPPTLEDVWVYFKFYFLRFFGSGILIFILCAIGFALCIIPGIYLSIPLSLALPVIVMENSSFSYAFNKSFRIIKGKWWMVFGVIFIVSMIIGIISSVAGLPISFITVGARFITLKNIILPLIIIFSVLRNAILLLYSIISVAVGMCYFSLTEEKDGDGLLGRIEGFGKQDEEQTGLPTEEY